MGGGGGGPTIGWGPDVKKVVVSGWSQGQGRQSNRC